MAESAAAWFRRARLRAGYASQAELARALGLARAAVANWESETVRGRPSRSILPRLGHLLGVSAEELAARFGIDMARPLALPAIAEPELLAAIEAAVARGVARGLREALAERDKGGTKAETIVNTEGAQGAGEAEERKVGSS